MDLNYFSESAWSSMIHLWNSKTWLIIHGEILSKTFLSGISPTNSKIHADKDEVGNDVLERQIITEEAAGNNIYESH